MANLTTSKQRIIEILNYYCQHGMKNTAETFDIKEETIARYLREAKINFGIDPKRNRVLNKLAEKFTDKELEDILSGSLIKPEKENMVINFDGETFVFGFITDTHIGSKFFHKHYLDSYFEEADKQNVQYTFHSGDLTEGLSHRPDHIYSLTHIGYSRQKEYVIELFQNYKKPVIIIDGNHDRWYIKGSGALIVKEIADYFDNWSFLGHDFGIITVNGIKIQLFHGEDGSSYATSYRVQKIIESIKGGEKPAILLTGHTHKMLYIIERNIHAISGGALSWQSDWMRSKRMDCHTGFWIVKTIISENEVKSFAPIWYPFYKELI